MNDKQKFIRSRKISLVLPWLGILGMLVLVYSLIMHGLLLFLTELCFIANFYYFIDEYNWIADRVMFHHEKLITHNRNNIIHIIMLFSIILALISTAILLFLRGQSFVAFCIGICFISIIYFSSRLIENCLIILHIAFNNWSKFYILVAVGTLLSITIGSLLLFLNEISYFLYFIFIGITYWITYYILIEIYRHVTNDLGGHKYFIDLPDNRFDMKH